MSDKAVDGSEVSQARDNEEENMKSGSDASPEPEEVIEEGDTTSVQAPSVEQLQVDDELDSIKEGVKRPHALAENGDHPHRKRKKADEDHSESPDHIMDELPEDNPAKKRQVKASSKRVGDPDGDLDESADYQTKVQHVMDRFITNSTLTHKMSRCCVTWALPAFLCMILSVILTAGV